MRANITDIRSKITTASVSSWNVTDVSVRGHEDLNSCYFLDETHGWIGGNKALYRTNDAGKSWKRIDTGGHLQGDITALFFANSSLGWIATERRESDSSSDAQNRFWLFQTADGGITWQLQHEDHGAGLTNISFADQKSGWLTGNRHIGISPLRFGLLLLHTSDGGQHWADVSGELNRVAADQKDSSGSPINDFVTAIIPEGRFVATVLTQRGRVFRSTDAGRSWQLVNVILDEPEQTCLCRLGAKEDGHLWVAGGADSVEGMWGMLAEEKQDHSWLRYRLGGAYFSDAVFTSENHVFACGSLSENGGKTEAAIFYSSDGGREWLVVYHNRKIERLTKLFATGPRDIWAVGERGLIVHLNPAAPLSDR